MSLLSTKGELSDEDFTLRTVESLEVDAMLDKFSPIKGKNKSENSEKNSVVTSTPNSKKSSKSKKSNKNKTENEKKKKSEVNDIFLELSGEAESMPQLFPTHYFNILNLFGVGCSSYKVQEHQEHHRKYSQNTVGQSSL